MVSGGPFLNESNCRPCAFWVPFHSDSTGFFCKVSEVILLGKAADTVVSAAALVPVSFGGFSGVVKESLPGKTGRVTEWTDGSFTGIKPVGLDFG